MLNELQMAKVMYLSSNDCTFIDKHHWQLAAKKSTGKIIHGM